MNIKSLATAAVLIGVSASAFAAAPTRAQVEEFAKKNPGYYELDPKSVTVEMLGVKTVTRANPAAGNTPAQGPQYPYNQPQQNNQYPQYPQYPYYPQYPQYPQQPVSVDPESGLPLDPNTGEPITDNSGTQIDPNTGQPTKPNGTNALLGTIDRIINLGERVFGIIAKNKPVVDVTVNYANAVPKGIEHWTDLEGWKAPKTVTYGWSVKNIYQVKVVQLKYQVIFTYGGSYNGKGKFLTGVSVIPLKLDVGWGYTVNVKCEVPDSTIANVGSKEDPIAGMSLILYTSIDTILKHDEYRDVFYIQGDGEFKKTS